jgi:hypothetical protein
LTKIASQEVREIYRNNLELEGNDSLVEPKKTMEETRKALNDHISSIYEIDKLLIITKGELESIKNEIKTLEKDLETKNKTA